MGLSDAEIAARLSQLNGHRFEEFVAELWQRRGWETTVTTRSNDKGIDIIATQDTPYQEKELIQAKRYQEGNRIGGPEIQQYASLRHQENNVDKVVIVTTSGFTDSALSIAKRANLKLIDGKRLVQLVSRLNSSDLVKNYTSDINTSSDHRVPKSTVKHPKEQQEDSTVTLSDTSDYLSMEVVGMGPVETTLQGSGFTETTHVDGIMFALKLFNHADTENLIEYLDAFELVDEMGNTYSPANLGGGQFDEFWEKHGGEFQGFDLKIIEPGSRIKYAIAFSMPDRAKPAELKLERYNVDIQFDHESRQRIPDLPPRLTGMN